MFQVFGPVMPIVPVRDHNEAIDLINDRYDQLLLVLFHVYMDCIGYVVGETGVAW